MAKTKIEDLPKGAEEMSAEEQKAAKGGAAKMRAQTLASATTLDTSLSQPVADATKLEIQPVKRTIEP